MSRLPKTKNGLARVALSVRRLLELTKEEVKNKYFSSAVERNIINNDKKSQNHANKKSIIFVSACVDERLKGDWKYNGGIKELNYLVKLLRQKGYESYIVTYDGKYENWLIEHQPHISLEDFKKMSNKNDNIRCVTSWAAAKSFLAECQEIYFWDMELFYSENDQFPLIKKLYDKKIAKVAGITRTIQAWHMSNFQKYCFLLPNLIDLNVWKASPEKREKNRIGYLDEGLHSKKYIEIIKNKTQGLGLEFILLKGNEQEILHSMQSCNIFLSLNIGKDKLWGEGCPRTIIESLAVGCISISFDIIGNREIIIDGYNGIITPRYQPDMMANAIIYLYKNQKIMESYRNNSFAILNACHTFEKRWLVIQKFLDL